MKKDFDEYFITIQAQYKELNDNIKELEEFMLNNICDETVYETMKKAAEPVANSYNQLCYVKYLLDMPAKNSKKNRYRNQNKKLNTGSVFDRNQVQVDKIKEMSK